MAKEIKVWIHDGRIYQTPCYIFNDQVDEYIKSWKAAVIEDAKQFNMDHYVYCTKTYNSDNELIEIDLYQQPLSDAQFDKRIKAVWEEASKQGNSIYFGVWHKKTAY